LRVAPYRYLPPGRPLRVMIPKNTETGLSRNLSPSQIFETNISGLRIFQPVEGWRFSDDAVFLSEFVIQIIRKVEKEAEGRSKNIERKDDVKFCIDIGAGCGIITLLLARELKNCRFFAIDIDKLMANLSYLNFRNNRVRAFSICGDIRFYPFRHESFDIIVSNPPYIPPDEGKKSDKYAIAKWEITLDLRTLADVSSRLLKDRGFVFVVYPSYRLGEVLSNFFKFGLKPVFIRFFHHSFGKSSDFFALACQKGVKHKLEVLPPFFKK